MLMNETMKISKWTKEILDEFKKVEDHKSYDSVIRSLIHRTLSKKKPIPKGMSINETINFFKAMPKYSYGDILKERIRGESE